jgi:hypothetical protein
VIILLIGLLTWGFGAAHIVYSGRRDYAERSFPTFPDSSGNLLPSVAGGDRRDRSTQPTDSHVGAPGRAFRTTSLHAGPAPCSEVACPAAGDAAGPASNVPANGMWPRG